MFSISKLSLVCQNNLKWSAAQEKAINREYPFSDIDEETPEIYVVRTYLQFLWLPESIMPLDLFVVSLQRVKVASSSACAPHPLHALIQPLLHSTRSSSSKYHVELPQILAYNGGEAEAEENMMWFAFNYEKMGQEGDQIRPNSEDSAIFEERWRKEWFERLERREVQLQIILYLLKLSLPGQPVPLPSITLPPPTNSPKKKGATKVKAKVITPTAEERLESFMDKLSMWQLVSTVNVDDSSQSGRTQTTQTDERDWMQQFCENIVEPLFKDKLPEACSLLRSKVFPESPFADDTASIASRSRSPSVEAVDSRPLDPHVLGQSYRANLQRPAPGKPSRPTSPSSHQQAEARSRSRSLSVSLAQDADARRAGSASSSANIRRALSREVSMSRVFKGKKAPEKPTNVPKNRSNIKEAEGRPTNKPGSSQAVTLVAATPVKPKVKRTASRAFGQPSNILRDTSPCPGVDVFGGETELVEEIWLPDSSPDVLLLPSFYMVSDDEQDDVMEVSTPVKKRSRVL